MKEPFFIKKGLGIRNPNEYYDCGEYIEIKMYSPTFGTYFIKVDKEDFEKVSKHNWKVRPDSKTVYGLNTKAGFIHRLITDCPADMQVDHINGDGLDNRKQNLRIVTNYENSRNKVNAIGYVVSKDGRRLKFRVIWKEQGKQISKGFETEAEALEFRKKIEKEVYKRPA